jgi:hypothetical protein
MFSSTVRRLIGAAAVVCLTASAVVVGSVAVPGHTLALPGATESTVVSIEPTRILDSRYNVGLGSRIANDDHPSVNVVGLIDTYVESTKTKVVKQVVPVGATGVFLNVTVVNPSHPGFLTVRPGTAEVWRAPSTGGINFDQGVDLANGIFVALPTTGYFHEVGRIQIGYHAPDRGAATDLIIDVVGYTTSSGLINLTKRIEALETTGPAGATGATGPAGPAGSAPDVGEDCSQMSYFAYTGSPVSASSWDVSNCDLRKANLANATLDDANLDDANLTGADLTGANLTDADLTDADLTDADLTNADLTDADLTDAILTSVTWSNTTCPNGFLNVGTDPC